MGSTGWISSLIPASLAREEALAVNIYVSDPDCLIRAAIYFFASWPKKGIFKFPVFNFPNERSNSPLANAKGQ